MYMTHVHNLYLTVMHQRLIGVCAEKDPVYIVMEFMPGGAFLDFLRKKGCSQTKKKLCLMCIDACQVSHRCIIAQCRQVCVFSHFSYKISNLGLLEQPPYLLGDFIH